MTKEISDRILLFLVNLKFLEVQFQILQCSSQSSLELN